MHPLTPLSLLCPLVLGSSNSVHPRLALPLHCCHFTGADCTRRPSELHCVQAGGASADETPMGAPPLHRPQPNPVKQTSEWACHKKKKLPFASSIQIFKCTLRHKCAPSAITVGSRSVFDSQNWLKQTQLGNPIVQKIANFDLPEPLPPSSHAVSWHLLSAARRSTCAWQRSKELQQS